MNDAEPSTRGPYLWTSACLSAGWLLSMAMVTYLVIDPLKYPLVALWRQSGRALDAAHAFRVVLDHGTLLMPAVVAMAGLLTIAVLVTERQTAGISRALRSPAGWLIFGAGLFWFGHAYLVPGDLLMGDLGNHIALVALRLRALTHGHDPYWNNYQYLGQPVSEFYAPTTFWPITILALAFGPVWATKLFLLLAHLGSGLAAYALTRGYGASRLASWLAGLIYAGSFAHLHLMLFRGTVPNALSLALLPLALLFLHRTLAQRDTSPYPATGLMLTMAVLLINYAPFGFVAALFLAAYAGVMLLAGAADWRRLLQLATAALATLGLAAWVLLPAALASRSNAGMSGDRILSLGLPGWETLNHLLLWRAWRTNYGHDSSAYLGIVAVALAGIGVGRVVSRRIAPAMRPPAAALILLLGLSFLIRGDFLRSIILTLTPFAALGGLGAQAVLTRFGGARHTPALLAGLLLLDLGPTAIQPQARTDLAAVEAAGAYLAAHRDEGRTLEGDTGSGRFVAVHGGGADVLQLYPSAFVVGGYLQLAGPAQSVAERAAALVEADLQTGTHLIAPTEDLLCQLRVKRIVAVRRTRMGLPADIPGKVDGPLGRVVEPDCHYAVVFATVTGHASPETGANGRPETVAERMGLDRLTGVAARLLLPQPLSPATASLMAGGAMPAEPPIVRAYHTTADRVHVVLSSRTPGFVRLPEQWYPQQRVLVNGRLVTSVPDVMGLHVVPVAAGESVIEIAPGTTPGALAGRVISAVAGLLIAAVLLVLRRRGTHRGTGRAGAVV